MKWARSSWPAALDGAALEARVPPSVLKCREVSRELTFSTRDAIANLRLEQRVMLLDQVLETWSFSFGFVIPGACVARVAHLESNAHHVAHVEATLTSVPCARAMCRLTERSFQSTRLDQHLADSHRSSRRGENARP